MASHSDIALQATIAQPEPLPPVDWAKIGQTAPVPIPIGARLPSDPLPAADIVILTWTTAEWSALDHVFLDSARPRNPDDSEWQKSWQLYSRGAAGYPTDLEVSGPLWGYFQVVQIVDQSSRPWRVLLLKANAHLAHSPWIDGLSSMIHCILEDARPDRVYSIGTAGGARLDQSLGDAVVTNAALLDLQQPQNTSDKDNGKIFRCPTWFPTSGLARVVQESLLFHLDKIITWKALEDLFEQLKAKHLDDPDFTGITLADLVNEPLKPENLGRPRVWAMKDISVLTTDFYYIAGGDGANAYSFLEMDDAVIAREAERMGVRYAFVRNVSNPVASGRTLSGKVISEAIRSDWSGAIYARCGFHTSYNGALAAWATIAGQGERAYNPPRSVKAPYPDDPLEIKLAYQVRSCGTCSYFWPEDKLKQPYGPYTAYDFDVNAPYTAAFPSSGAVSAPWVLGRTRPPAFPEAEVVDGCRKAPIMTIGINPNLTAFAPGQTGTSWCYPTFFSDDATDAWAKYAWYYRYRSVYQERLAFDFARRFILPEGQIVAPRSGHVTTAIRATDSAASSIKVRYDGDSADTEIKIPGVRGDFPYVLLLDTFAPRNTFAAGDTIAGRLSVPEGIQVEIQQQQQGYYMQFVPVLERFQQTLRKAGHPANLRIGEDVCQLDMVACASPHWNAGFLGGSQQSIDTIVNNCVSSNAWAIKQLVQTRPAVLYIVSQSSWNMFHGAFGAHVRRDPPVSSKPIDNDYTLLRETTDPDHPCNLVLNATIDDMEYQCTTRLVITPHFSYNDNFFPQYRLSQAEWQDFSQKQPACAATMAAQNGFTIVPGDPSYPNAYLAIQLSADPQKAAAARTWLQQLFPQAFRMLEKFYYDPHAMMAGVLDQLLKEGKLAWQEPEQQATGKKVPGYLARTYGSCHFCVNQHWQFPLGCPYGKPKEAPPPPGFLEKVAQYIVKTGRPAQAADAK